MTCMRSVSWEAIKNAAAAIKPAKSTSVLRGIPAFWPTPDGEVIYSSEELVEMTEKEEFARLPILAGNTANENGYYQIPAYASGIVPTQEKMENFLLESFTCHVAYQAKARRKYRTPAYVYRYFADWDNTRLYPTSGAYHGVNMHLLVGASGDVSGIPPNEDQKELTGLMQWAWFAFVDDPVSGLAGLRWPALDEIEKTLVILGVGNALDARLEYPSDFHGKCGNMTMGALRTL